MLLVTHPDNVKKIQSLCKTDESYVSYGHLFHSGYKLIEFDLMPPTRPSGRYSINGEGRFLPEDICIKTPFITYGPEDLEWLIFAGVAKELPEMNVLCMHEQQWDFFKEPMEPMMMSGCSGLGKGRKLAESMRLIKDIDFEARLNLVWRPKSIYFGDPL